MRLDSFYRVVVGSLSESDLLSTPMTVSTQAPLLKFLLHFKPCVGLWIQRKLLLFSG